MDWLKGWITTRERRKYWECKMERVRTALEYLAARLSEPSTWQGIGFVVALFGSKFGAGLAWEQAAGLGGLFSAVLKIIFPDKITTKPEQTP